MDNTEVAHKGTVTTMNTNMFEISKFVKWSVAGDGCVTFGTNNTNAHYTISRDPKHTDYIELIQNKLTPIVGINIVITESTRRDNNKTVVHLRTNSLPIFTRVRERQYVGNHRVLDPHMLTMLDWEALAFLYMDDGSLCFTQKGSSLVRISACAYSYFEQMALRKALAEKLGLTFNVNKTGRGLYQLNLAKKDQNRFFDGVTKYVVPSYQYKLPLYSQEEAPPLAA